MHVVVPVLFALGLYRPRWRSALLLMLATMLVDADHLLADPIYAPERCSIGFHPLHRAPAIVLYAFMFALPLVLRRTAAERRSSEPLRAVHLVGLGLLIHMALDAIDCVV